MKPSWEGAIQGWSHVVASEPCGGPGAMQWAKPKPNSSCQMCSPKPLAQQMANISPLHTLVELMSISTWAQQDEEHQMCC